MKKQNSLTATRVRYQVVAVRMGRRVLVVGRCSKKADALETAKYHQPCEVEDTMARIGGEQVWRVDDGGIKCLQRRT